jgi:hypothetical protein
MHKLLNIVSYILIGLVISTMIYYSFNEISKRVFIVDTQQGSEILVIPDTN